MKRRQMLRLLGLAPPVFLFSCQDPKLPSAPTIVTGKVIDENDLPIVGVFVRMYGKKQEGLSSSSTFSIDTLTGKDGNFTLSYVVPSGTDFVNIRPTETSAINGQTHNLNVQKNGLPNGSPELQREDYGKTTTINFQYKKR